MANLVMKHNLSTPSLVSYYSSLWSGSHQVSFSSSQARGWLTDMEMVAREYMGDMEICWDSVMVHKAVILTLCPQLARLTKLDDGSQEGSKIIFTDYPLEIIKSFVQLVYTGSCPLSPVADDVKNILEFMGSLGIVIQLDRFEVISSTADSVESLVMMKNRSGDATVSKLISKDTIASQIVLGNEAKRKGRFMDDIIEHVVNMAHSLDEKDSVLVVNSNSVLDVMTRNLEKKRDKNKSTDKRFSCEHCEFECRFWIQLVQHADDVHTDKLFSCEKCSFKTSKLMYVRNHVNQVHKGPGKGKFQCEECGFKALNPQKLLWHQKFHQKKIEVSSVSSVDKFSCDKGSFNATKITSVRNHVKKIHVGKGRSLKCEYCGFKATSHERLGKHQSMLHEKVHSAGNPSRKAKESTKPRRVKIPEETFHCHFCDYNTHFKKSLERHVRRFHEDHC